MFRLEAVLHHWRKYWSKHIAQGGVLPSHPEQLLPKCNYRGCKYICFNGWYYSYNYKHSIYLMHLWTNKAIKAFEILDSRECPRLPVSYSCADGLGAGSPLALLHSAVRPRLRCPWVPRHTHCSDSFPFLTDWVVFTAFSNSRYQRRPKQQPTFFFNLFNFLFSFLYRGEIRRINTFI